MTCTSPESLQQRELVQGNRRSARPPAAFRGKCTPKRASVGPFDVHFPDFLARNGAPARKQAKCTSGCRKMVEVLIACRTLVSRAALRRKRPLPRIDFCRSKRFERKATATDGHFTGKGSFAKPPAQGRRHDRPHRPLACSLLAATSSRQAMSRAVPMKANMAK